MNIKLPKNASNALVRKARKTIHQIENGTAKLRKTQRFGYTTVALGHCERAVLLQDTLHIFSKHREYEKFINKAA